MHEVTFTCSACGQEISVNEQMREAILENGCPICASETSDADFG